MSLSCSFVNVYTKYSKHLLSVDTNAAANNKKLMFFSYDDDITLSNSQQLPVTSALGPNKVR